MGTSLPFGLMSPIQEVILAVAVAFFGAFLYQGVYVMWPDRRGAFLITFGAIGLLLTPVMVLPEYRAWAISLIPRDMPRPYFFIPLALAGSVGISISRQLTSDLSLRRTAAKMAIELEDWSVLARSNLPQFSTTAVHSAEAARRDAEYSEKFGPRIVQLMKPLAKRDRIHLDLRDSFLRVPPKNTLDVASTAYFASTYFARYGRDELPIPAPRQWFSRQVLVPASLYFTGACAVWLLMFLFAHK